MELVDSISNAIPIIFGILFGIVILYGTWMDSQAELDEEGSVERESPSRDDRKRSSANQLMDWVSSDLCVTIGCAYCGVRGVRWYLDDGSKLGIVVGVGSGAALISLAYLKWRKAKDLSGVSLEDDRRS